MLCSLYNGVSGRCVRIRDHRIACVRSNGGMHMHTYHGGYPTISHFRLYTMLCCSQHGSANLVDLCSYHWRTLVEAKKVMDPNLKFKLAQYYLLPSPQKGCRYYLPPPSVVKYGYIYTLNCI
jgi:hypothetical protein